MKRIFIIVVIALFPLIMFAQQDRILSLIENDVYELNGGIRAGIGGRSRIILPLAIPFNTKAIIYTVVAKRSNEPIEKDFSLVLALGTLISTGSLTLSDAVSKIAIPTGSTTVETYLIPTRQDAENFRTKNDNSWRMFSDFSRYACQSCKVLIPINYSFPNQLYIGIKNPSSLQAVTIILNVVAVM